jgi:hypothetical protein
VELGTVENALWGLFILNPSFSPPGEAYFVNAVTPVNPDILFSGIFQDIIK